MISFSESAMHSQRLDFSSALKAFGANSQQHYWMNFIIIDFSKHKWLRTEEIIHIAANILAAQLLILEASSCSPHVYSLEGLSDYSDKALQKDEDNMSKWNLTPSQNRKFIDLEC